jgi:hypothetical protein
MLDFIKREALVRKGLACGKTRRKREANDWKERLNSGVWPRVFLFVAFAAMLVLLLVWGRNDVIYESVQTTLAQDAELGRQIADQQFLHAGKSFLVALLVLATSILQLWINHPETFRRNSRLLLVYGSILTQLVIIKFILTLAENGTMDESLAYLILPYSLAPLLLSVLLGKNHGIFAAIFASLWGAFLQPEIAAIPEFLVISLISGFIAVYLTQQVRRRNQLVRAGLFIGLATWVLALAFGLIGPIRFGQLMGTEWDIIGLQSLMAVLNGMIVAFMVGGILPMLEGFFKITTDMTWLELADLNHPLLRRMTREAHGTYSHSMRVADLAEAGAEAIGANGTMCRVCAYFHDIGKLIKPEYFTENIPADADPHADLSPTMSALIITAHVKEGVSLALKHNLNQRIVDIIQQHHGNTLVYFFYRRAMEQRKAALTEQQEHDGNVEDVPEVQEETFRYPGPRPQFKESGIIHIADSLESASRSLEKPTPQKIDQLVKDIMSTRINDGQLDDCDLTLKDINKLTEAFRYALQSMLHTRVAYPKREAEEKARRPAGRPSPSAALPPSVTDGIGESAVSRRPEENSPKSAAARGGKRKTGGLAEILKK